jgi:hypothetical protein
LGVHLGQQPFHLSKVLSPIIEALATTKALRMDLGLQMLKQNKNLHLALDDVQIECQKHPTKREIQTGEKRLQLSSMCYKQRRNNIPFVLFLPLHC